MSTSSTPRTGTGPVACQAGPLHLSLHHTGDDQDPDGTTRHRYEYTVTNQQSTSQRYQATDLHNRGAVNTNAAMCALIGYLHAIGRTVRDYHTDPGDSSMNHLPAWLPQTTTGHLEDLRQCLEAHEELQAGPTDLTFDFDDPHT